MSSSNCIYHIPRQLVWRHFTTRLRNEIFLTENCVFPVSICGHNVDNKQRLSGPLQQWQRRISNVTWPNMTSVIKSRESKRLQLSPITTESLSYAPRICQLQYVWLTAAKFGVINDLWEGESATSLRDFTISGADPCRGLYLPLR